MPDQRLSIYNASAGSGKTFQIAKNFLFKILQSPEYYYTSRLIGLTFTNKAANEMKKRILDILTDAAKEKNNPMIPALAEELHPVYEKQYQKELSKEEVIKIISERSQRRLKEILHQYDDFNLMTIDKLSFKIIRTFAREMNLPYDVNIVMDYNEIIDNLIDEIISDLNPGDELLKNLTRLALENVENEKHWDITHNLKQITRLIFDENQRNEINSLKTKSREDIIRLKNTLQKKVVFIRNQYREMGNKGLKIINLGGEAFGVKKLMDNMASISGHNQIEFSDSLLKKLDKKELISKNTLKKRDPANHESIRNAEKQMLELLNKAYTFHLENFERYMLYKGILQEINSLIILHSLLQKIEEYKELNHSIFISDFNELIQQQIMKNIGEETPYIYMRLGEKFIHYFLDEFQDTSELQWLNMIPLIKEALSKDFSRTIDKENPGTSMIVGDAKQSIYRFRNGKPEIFIDLSDEEQQKGQGNPFYPITGKKIYQLEENWRSDGQIIRFNNHFFSHFKNLLPRENYRRVYEHVKQRIPAAREKVKEKGYVSISFEESLSAKNEAYKIPEKIHQVIMDALARGFHYDDICFLYNSHEDSVPVAEYLGQHNIPFLAEKSLKLGKSQKVNSIIHFLKYLFLQKTEPLFDSLYFLFNYHSLSEADQFLYEALENPEPEPVFSILHKAGFSLQPEKLYTLNLFDLIIYLIDKFRFNEDTVEENYLQTFLDDVYHYTLENKTGVIGYLMHWNKMKAEIDVQAPDKTGAVQFMTVHASKGLEFPIVIYLAKGSIFSKNKDLEQVVWIDTPPESFEGFEKLPVKLRALEKVENYRDIYNRELAKKMFDNFNRLYVAHTRPSNELYIFTDQPAKKPNPLDFKSMYAEFIQENKGIEKEDTVSYGEKTKALKQPKTTIEKIKGNLKNLHYWNENPHQQNLKLRTRNYELWRESKKAAIKYGLQMHEILSQITTIEQWEKEKEKFLSVIPPDEKEKVKHQIEKILYHPEITQYFSSNYRILNERAILIPAERSFYLRRPDRILLRENKAVIMDYKTGEKNPKHQKQLEEYAGLLEDTGYNVEKKILVYLGEEPEIREI